MAESLGNTKLAVDQAADQRQETSARQACGQRVQMAPSHRPRETLEHTPEPAPKVETWPLVYVVVPAFNRCEKTLRFLGLLSRVSYANRRVVVVDDGSTDGTRYSIELNFPEVEVLQGDGNLWWSGGTNLGVAYALEQDADYILTINDDAVMEPDFLTNLVATARQNPRYIVGCRLHCQDRRDEIWAIGSEPAFRAGTLFRLNFAGRRWQDLSNTLPDPYPVQTMPGNGVLIPRAVFERVGYYDAKHMPQYHADSDLVLRARQAGFQPVISLKSVLYNHILEKPLVDNRIDMIFSMKSDRYWRALWAILRRHAPWGRRTYLLLRQYSPFFFNKGILRHCKRFLRWLLEGGNGTEPAGLTRGYNPTCTSGPSRVEATPTTIHLHALYTGHWAGNLGDSAVFDAFERMLPDHVRLTVEVHTSGPWRHRPQTQLIHWEDREAAERALRACDAAILLGTTVVTDLHGGEWPIVTIIEALRRARAAGKPVHAVGVGTYAGPWEEQRKRLVHEFVPLIDSFTVRDEASRQVLLNAGAPADRTILAADLAWLLDRPRYDGAARREMETLTGGAPAVAVNVVHEDWYEAEAFYRSVAEELDAFSAERATTTVFLCNEVREGEYYDGAAAERVKSFMRSSATIHEVRWMNPEEMVARLSCCRLAVSMRYHFSLFAALAGTPWVAFERGGKLRSLLEEFGMQAVGPMGESTNGRLLAAMRQVWEHRQESRARQRQVVESLCARARRCDAFLRTIRGYRRD